MQRLNLVLQYSNNVLKIMYLLMSYAVGVIELAETLALVAKQSQILVYELTALHTTLTNFLEFSCALKATTVFQAI